MGKLVLLGLDGADWGIIDPLVKEGALPNFKKMIDGGSHARLRSTIPALAAPSWASIFTGVNPGKHGIFEFVKVGNGRIKLTNGMDEAPYVWAYLDRMRCLAFNIPFSYPLRPVVNTILVSGYMTPDASVAFADPPEVKNEILSAVPDYKFDILAESVKLDFDSMNKRPDGTEIDKSPLAGKLLESLESRISVSKRLLDNKPWDAAFLVFSEPHWAQHFFLGEFSAAVKKSDSVIGKLYKMLDDYLGYLIMNNHNVIVVSEHGFGQIKKTFYVNSFLKQKGHVKVKRQFLKSALKKLGITQGLAMSLVPVQLFRMLRGTAIADIGKNNLSLDESEGDIDQIHSDGYLNSSHGCGIVIKNREKVESIRKALLEASDDDGSRMLRSVLSREDIYKGPMVRYAPDLIVVPNEGVDISDILKNRITEQKGPHNMVNGYHDGVGIFVSHGPDFIRKGRMEDLSVFDITPTILSYFGYEPLESMDGRRIPIFERSGNLKSALKKQDVPIGQENIQR